MPETLDTNGRQRMNETSATRSAGRGRVAVALVIPVLVALAVAGTARAVSSGRTQAATHAVAAATASSANIDAAAGVGAALRLYRLLHPDRQAVLRSLTSPALKPNASAALAAETPCGQTPGLLCSTVTVPLDRTGVVPGTVDLHVERLPALGVAKGEVFLIAGGPGQGSARAFGLGTPDNADFYRFLFPGYTIVAYDDRGTGSSGLLRCPTLETYVTSATEGPLVSACADQLGTNRAFYGTVDHAEDLEAVRASFGVDKVALWGVSYGTKLAMAYAQLHGDHVERLLLDSVLPTNLPDPYFSNVLQAMPNTLSSFCSNAACKAASPNLAADVAAVANQLDAKPVTGKVLQLSGATRTVRITGEDVLSVVVDADLNPGLAAELPAVMHEARGGDLRPLLRIFQLDSAAQTAAPEDLSSALFAATTCRDGPFPWDPTTPVADRAAIVQSGIGALPAGSFGPFGAWAAKLGNATFCLNWPPPAGGAAYGTGAVPDVPVLAVSGGFDMRTPTSSATAVASQFPQGKVLLVPGVGHSVVTADPSFCAARQVRAWMLGDTVLSQCPLSNPYLSTVPAFAPVRTTKPKPASTTKTLALAMKTIREAEGMWLMTLGGNGAVAGVYSGRLLTTATRTFTLVHYSVAPGVELSGRIRFVKFGPPLQFDGVVTVGGTGAAHGLLGIAGDKVGGTLDGTIVSG
jgi:pimeloyl-ACP methyl ester carboxylesterase